MTVVCPGPALEASAIGAGSVFVIAGGVEQLILLSVIGGSMVVWGVIAMRKFYRKHERECPYCNGKKEGD